MPGGHVDEAPLVAPNTMKVNRSWLHGDQGLEIRSMPPWVSGDGDTLP
jgi:hypothetical protein